MPDDAIDHYRRFLAGEQGICIFTRQEDCYAFATEDEIEATYGSRHDGHHFVWLGALPGKVGFVSDDHIDALLASGHVAFFYSEMSGPIDGDHQTLKAAFLLGAARMKCILDLPVDAEKRVQRTAIDTLPLSQRVLAQSLALPAPIPLARLVEAMLPLGANAKNAEARGRLAVLARAAADADLCDIEGEAERCAAWIVDRASREKQVDEITSDMFDKLALRKSKA